MAKKTRRAHKRRRTRRHRKVRRGGADKYPLIPPDSAFPHSTAGESSDNVMGYRPSSK